MNITNLLTVCALALMIAPQALKAGTPSRSEKLMERYEERRARMLIRINERFINVFEREIEAAEAASQTKGTRKIQRQINKLQNQNEKLTAKLDDAQAGRLIGKTAHFPHNRDPDFTARVEFEEDGNATWVGLGNVAVEWVWEPGGEEGLYHFWSPYQRTRETGWTLRLSPDGQTAEVEGLQNGYRAEAGIRKTDRKRGIPEEGQAANPAADDCKCGKNDNELAEKTLSFPDRNAPDTTITVRFERDWTGSWLGRAGVRIPQFYRQEGPGEYYFWPASEPPGVFGWKLKLSPDGKTALLNNVRFEDTAEGKSSGPSRILRGAGRFICSL